MWHEPDAPSNGEFLLSVSMKILIIKTSSLGDVIHTLPALTDAVHAMPDISFDWVVERGFAEIPSWHPRVNKVIPLAWRRWRKNISASWREGEFKKFYQDLREQNYDRVIDAQGLVKSAIITRLSKGQIYGLDFRSAREPLASLFYQKRVTVEFKQHAVKRMRQLFALCLGYPIPEDTPDYGIRHHFAAATESHLRQVLFFHGTTWIGKEWPEAYWQTLAKKCVALGREVLLPWGNEVEKQRAEDIAAGSPGIRVLPKMDLQGLAQILLQVECAVAVDTGLGHLAAAFDVPTISLYGPTDPAQIGACGRSQIHLRAPAIGNDDRSLVNLSPDVVWEKLLTLFV